MQISKLRHLALVAGDWKMNTANDEQSSTACTEVSDLISINYRKVTEQQTTFVCPCVQTVLTLVLLFVCVCGLLYGHICAFVEVFLHVKLWVSVLFCKYCKIKVLSLLSRPTANVTLAICLCM